MIQFATVVEMSRRVITFRIPDALLREIDKYVENGRFMNRSDFITFALQKTIMELECGSNG